MDRPMKKEKKEERRNIGISEEPGDETMEMRPVEVLD
jgi:hypothetical protein